MTASESSTTLVVMGVSGAGKTSVALALVARTRWAFAEGDDLHPERNRQLMAAGRALTDEDRWPWLGRVAAWIGENEMSGRNAVLTCSALRRSYREVLRTGHPSVRFVHLVAPDDALRGRLEQRQGHYMPAALLRSQLIILEPLDPDEPGVTLATTGSPDTVADLALAALDIPVADAYGW